MNNINNASLQRYYIKKILQHSCFPMKFGKFLRTLFSQNFSSDSLCTEICQNVFCVKKAFSSSKAQLSLLHFSRHNFFQTFQN